jgi:16S rRNA (cytosine967-C5)-methyltransferase
MAKKKISVSPARRVAFDILRRVESGGAYASLLMTALSESKLSSQDRALAYEIVMGVLRWRRWLDYFIERYSRRRVEQIDLPVLIALRMGIYQLRRLAGIPAFAAVNESVALVKATGLGSAAGMVNAVLRAAARSLGDEAGDGVGDSIERLAIEVSHPRWMIERWQHWLGQQEARELALANNMPPHIAFRVNTLRRSVEETLSLLRSEGVRFRPSELVKGAFIAEQGVPLATTRAAQEGLIYIQDEASQLVSLLLDPQAGERILDLCAAPGSKSSHIAALTGNKAWIVACDIHSHRLVQLVKTCKRLGASSVDALVLDALQALPIAEGQQFDRALVDAPCSGTGTLRQNPEIKWKLKPHDIPRLAEMQFNLLVNAAGALKVGGRLVYSTCSIEPEENEQVIERFLGSNSRFELIRLNAPAELVTSDGFIRTFPHRHAMDGFFVALLEKH